MRNEVLQNFKTCTRYTSNAEAEARGNICPPSLRISSVNVNRKLQKTADLVTFTEEILNGKLHFLCSGEATMKRYSIDLLSLGCEKKIPDPSHSLCTAYLHNKQLILYLRQTCTLLKF